MTEARRGALVVVATPIGNLGDLSPRAVAALEAADLIACEDTRRTRKLLTHAGLRARLLMTVHGHNEAAQATRVLERLHAGDRVALVSDAGTPGIADPGARLVRAAIGAGIAVEVVPGPSAVIAALVISGLSTERFCFEGFLPRKGSGRAERLQAVAGERRTTVLYEAPHRLRETLADLVDVCGPERPVAVVRELTKVFEEVWRGRLVEAAARVAATEPRGEIVVVLAGAPAPPPPDAADLEAALLRHLGEGTDRRTAIDRVARELAVSRRDVYEVAVRLKN
jgi:16S rRNA (cytidine1402-2'-O)-methyltransferase